jgi:ribosomal protein L16 Arg81 hydroxylase
MSAFEEFLSGKKTAEELNIKKTTPKKDSLEEVLQNQKVLIEQNKKIIGLLEKLVS